MKIGFFDAEGWEEAAVKEALSGHEVVFSGESLDETTALPADDFDAVTTFVKSRINENVLAKLPRLKFIATRSTGYDHIDLDACKTRGIQVGYVPGYGDNTVAEFAFGLILALTRKVYEAVDRVKETGSFSQKGLKGIDLKGKTLGVVGTGRIGKESIRIGKGFGMNVVAYDPFPNEAAAAELGFKYLDFPTLLSTSDVITLHAPYTKETHHLINKGNIAEIKKGAYLVNTARGPLVETEALVEALKNGTLAGAGLDVLEEEGETWDELKFLTHGHPKEEEMRVILENHILMEMPNVLVAPHNAFNTQEALERILKTSLDNLVGFATGGRINLVP